MHRYRKMFEAPFKAFECTYFKQVGKRSREIFCIVTAESKTRAFKMCLKEYKGTAPIDWRVNEIDCYFRMLRKKGEFKNGKPVKD